MINTLAEKISRLLGIDSVDISNFMQLDNEKNQGGQREMQNVQFEEYQEVKWS